MPADVMYVTNQIVEALQTIDGLRVLNRPTQNVSPPWAAVSFPRVTFDTTYGRGLDRLEYEVTVIVGMRNERTAIERVTEYIAEVKDAIESHDEFETAWVVSGNVEVIPLGDTNPIDYLGIVFQVVIEAGSELAP